MKDLHENEQVFERETKAEESCKTLDADLVDESKDLSGLVGFIKRVMFETHAPEMYAQVNRG